MYQFKESVILRLVKSFYDKNDISHRLPHLKCVVTDTKKFCKYLQLDKDTTYLTLVAAYYHDIFANNIEEHHTLGFDYIIKGKDVVLQSLNMSDRVLVAHAIKEHGVDYTGGMYSKVSKILRAADRGAPDYCGYLNRECAELSGREYNDLNEIPDKVLLSAVIRVGCKKNIDSFKSLPIYYREVYKSETVKYINILTEVTKVIERILILIVDGTYNVNGITADEINRLANKHYDVGYEGEIVYDTIIHSSMDCIKEIINKLNYNIDGVKK